MKNKITNEKLEKYFLLTKTALKKVKTKINSPKKQDAKEIIDMASNYISDAEYFKKNSDFVNAFAALNYAHGWIDTGARLGIFNVKDNKLFTVK
jgi:uncharacterized protein